MRRVNHGALRSLDAIHLASALLIDADLVRNYDDRLVVAPAVVPVALPELVEKDLGLVPLPTPSSTT